MRGMMKLGRCAVLLLCVIIGLRPNAAQAIGQECMAMYYRSRSPACIDGMLAEFRQRPQSDLNTLIGFLAQIFRTSREERERVLNVETSDQLKAADIVSLYRAGLSEEADAFAKANNLSALADKVRATRQPTLDAVKPAVPADNDLLVGACMASGDTRFIQRILATYSGADDGMVSDGLRIGFMMSKFGPTLAAKGRNAVTMQAACDRC